MKIEKGFSKFRKIEKSIFFFLSKENLEQRHRLGHMYGSIESKDSGNLLSEDEERSWISSHSLVWRFRFYGYEKRNT